MTIGQRIARNRRELGLSQESLGEELGVSRQSIYKWESDAALPEIDKLVALSKRFGVPVGVLLGVEEPSGGEGSSGTGRELTEDQLKMVEEIVERYTAALPKPVPKKRRVFKTAVAAAVVCLAALLYHLSGKLDRLDSRYSSLQEQVSQVNTNMNIQIGSISGQVENLLKTQNDLTADYGTEISSEDLANNAVAFSVYAVPKTYMEGMRAEFYAGSGAGSAVSAPDVYREGERFGADIRCTLSDHITLTVVFVYPDGSRKTQVLDEYYNLYSDSLPVVDLMSYQSLLYETVVDGAFTTPEDLYLSTNETSGIPSGAAAGGAADPVEVGRVRVGLFRNRKLIAWAEPCPERPDFFHGDDPGDSSYYYFPPTALQDLSMEDELCFAAVVTDEYGREIVYQDVPYVLVRDGNGETSFTWPTGSAFDNDPSHWEY